MAAAGDVEMPNQPEALDVAPGVANDKKQKPKSLFRNSTRNGEHDERPLSDVQPADGEYDEIKAMQYKEAIEDSKKSKFRTAGDLDDWRTNKEWSGAGQGFCCACWYCFANFLAYWASCCVCCFGTVIPNMACWQFNLCSSCCYNKFDDLEPDMQTGDVVLFGGTRMLKYAQMSVWSHIGMIYVDRTGDVVDHDGFRRPPGTKYIFEANYSAGENGAPPKFDGACFVPLKMKVVNYKKGSTDVAYRKMGAAARNLPDFLDRIDEAVMQLDRTGYDHDQARGLNAILDCCSCCERAGEATDDEEFSHKMFCSELIAAVYQLAGILPKPPNGPPHSEYVPRDFGHQCSANMENQMLEELFEGSSLQWIERADQRWCWSFDWYPLPVVLCCCCCCNVQWPCCDFRRTCCEGKEPVLFQEDKSLLIKDDEQAAGMRRSAHSPRSRQGADIEAGEQYMYDKGERTTIPAHQDPPSQPTPIAVKSPA